MTHLSYVLIEPRVLNIDYHEVYTKILYHIMDIHWDLLGITDSLKFFSNTLLDIQGTGTETQAHS